MLKNYLIILTAIFLSLSACKMKQSTASGKRHATVEPLAAKPFSIDSIQYGLKSKGYYPFKKIVNVKEYYQIAYKELESMLKGETVADFERAVFISENPYHNNVYGYKDFQDNISLRLLFVKSLIAANDKSDTMEFNAKVGANGRFKMTDIRYLPEEKKRLYKNALRNWAIFTYLTDTTALFPFHNLPFTYSTQDPFGRKDWKNSQVIGLLTSEEQKGNCYAMTALYKIMADRLNSGARLCTAPQHIYIQHQDPKGHYYNVELATAGHPGDGTIQTLTHTPTEAIMSGIALRSYDEKQSIGLCLVNLAKSYEHKFDTKDDEFMLQCAELVLKYDSLNLNALLLKQQILDARVTLYANTNNIADIKTLKKDNRISKTMMDLEMHTVILYKLGYRQMPFDMQQIIMTGIYPETFKDKNPSPFTSFTPPDEHRQHYHGLYGGLFVEVFETKTEETFGNFIYNTKNKTITKINPKLQTENCQLIDPVAFAYDFGARIYDARLGRWLSTDPLQAKYPSMSPYIGMGNNPIVFVDVDGRDIIPSDFFLASREGKIILGIINQRNDFNFTKKYLNPFTEKGKDLEMRYHNMELYKPSEEGTITNAEGVKKNDNLSGLVFNSGNSFFDVGIPSNTQNIDFQGKQLSKIGVVSTFYHELIHANGMLHEEMSQAGNINDFKNALLLYASNNEIKLSPEYAELLAYTGLENTTGFTAKFGKKGSRTDEQKNLLAKFQWVQDNILIEDVNISNKEYTENWDKRKENEKLQEPIKTDEE